MKYLYTKIIHLDLQTMIHHSLVLVIICWVNVFNSCIFTGTSLLRTFNLLNCSNVFDDCYPISARFLPFHFLSRYNYSTLNICYLTVCQQNAFNHVFVSHVQSCIHVPTHSLLIILVLKRNLVSRSQDLNINYVKQYNYFIARAPYNILSRCLQCLISSIPFLFNQFLHTKLELLEYSHVPIEMTHSIRVMQFCQISISMSLTEYIKYSFFIDKYMFHWYFPVHMLVLV